MKYIIISGQNIDDMANKVNEHTQLGWEPIGGVQFDRINLPYQTMVKQTADIPALLKPKAKTTKGEK